MCSKIMPTILKIIEGGQNQLFFLESKATVNMVSMVSTLYVRKLLYLKTCIFLKLLVIGFYNSLNTKLENTYWDSYWESTKQSECCHPVYADHFSIQCVPVKTRLVSSKCNFQNSTNLSYHRRRVFVKHFSKKNLFLVLEGLATIFAW